MNHCSRGKEISITYRCVCVCVCVHVALVIQHGTHKRHIVMSLVAPLAPPYFSTFTHKRYDFGKKSC